MEKKKGLLEYPNLTNKQKDILKKAIKEFMQGGVSIKHVVNAISKEFSPELALIVATTEITRAQAEKVQKEGEELKKEWKDVPVIKIWYTCNDTWFDENGERQGVCEICEALSGKEVEIDKSFAEGIFIPPVHPSCRCWIDSSTAFGE